MNYGSWKCFGEFNILFWFRVNTPFMCLLCSCTSTCQTEDHELLALDLRVVTRLWNNLQIVFNMTLFQVTNKSLIITWRIKTAVPTEGTLWNTGIINTVVELQHIISESSGQVLAMFIFTLPSLLLMYTDTVLQCKSPAMNSHVDQVAKIRAWHKVLTVHTFLDSAVDSVVILRLCAASWIDQSVQAWGAAGCHSQDYWIEQQLFKSYHSCPFSRIQYPVQEAPGNYSLLHSQQLHPLLQHWNHNWIPSHRELLMLDSAPPSLFLPSVLLLPLMLQPPNSKE